MTFAETADRYAPRDEDIIGPYSRWPRRPPRSSTRWLAFAVGVAAAGAFDQWALPLLF